jgi:hypothetical protein
MLSATFLLMFTLALMDFSKGFASQTRTLIASRHVAWTAARAHENPYDQPYESSHPHHHPGPPAVDQLKALHFYGRAGDVTYTTREWTYTLLNAVIDIAALMAGEGSSDSGGDDWQNDDSDGTGSGLVSEIAGVLDGAVGRGLFGWGLGKVWGREAVVEQTVPGLRLFTGGKARARHVVALYAAPEHEPSERWGWFDFIQRGIDWVVDKIGGLF